MWVKSLSCMIFKMAGKSSLLLPAFYLFHVLLVVYCNLWLIFSCFQSFFEERLLRSQLGIMMLLFNNV